MPVYLYSDEDPKGRRFETYEVNAALEAGWMEAPVWGKHLQEKRQDKKPPWMIAQEARKAKLLAKKAVMEENPNV